MERRVYFILGDLLACIVAGAAGGWLAQLTVPGDWFVPIGMGTGMALGMLAGMIGGFLLTPFFGSIEVMLPAVLSGMVAGMGIGMRQTMAGIGPGDATLGGVMAGLLCLVFTYLVQAKLHGKTQ